MMSDIFTIRIDGREVSVRNSMTVLEAAEQSGIVIPTLCHLKITAPKITSPKVTCTPVSCQVCLVKVNGRIMPSCATEVLPGMIVESETDELQRLRRTALELLLSDHTGDCYAPCQGGCPARLDIPNMLRHIGRGEFKEALLTIWERIPLPAVLGRVCSRPCEKICRRTKVDGAVAICQLKRFVADSHLGENTRILPSITTHTGYNIAVIGAGPAGLSATWFLTLAGHAVTLFERNSLLGGRLRKYSDEILPTDVLDLEIEHLLLKGTPYAVDFRAGEEVLWTDPNHRRELLQNFDAVILAFGACGSSEVTTEETGLKWGPRGIIIEPETYRTHLNRVFAIGTAVRKDCQIVRSVADGQEVAKVIKDYILADGMTPSTGHESPDTKGDTEKGKHRNAAVRIKTLRPNELQELAKTASPAILQEPLDAGINDYTPVQAQEQAARCYHCDCRGRDKCRLLPQIERICPDVNRFVSEERPPLRIRREGNIVFEPGKCIKCGLCVRLTSEWNESFGLAFIGRGFDVQVEVPFHRSLLEGLGAAAEVCIASCPTGALVFDKDFVPGPT